MIDPPASSSPHLLVRAARGEPVPRPPVWAMRQAGRWDPEFNQIRAGLSFYEFSERVDLAAKASLLPRRFGVDAIILFYDITTLTVAMGLPFTLQPSQGPVPDRPVRTLADVERLEPHPEPARFRHIRELLATVKGELAGALPVIVFAGAPFTLATYCIGTGKDMAATRRFAAEQPKVWDALLGRISTATVHFLDTLVQDGADLYQLFDSWAGLLERAEYERWAQVQHAKILAAVAGVPRILFVKECPYLELMAASGADVISLGIRHDLAAARQAYPQLSFQGNVDEEILRGGTPEQVAEATRRCIEAGGGRRHIVNLNHGVDRGTPVENFEAYIHAAKASVEA
ncbi:uroporphyrinogen decarboxylase [Planctomycetaceae bacterium SCGC AG-212-D15]|nr:uroporphyrinogen decarboxylase [Planctomycetaceae bacterium SCGC AG-212-D15]